ncbi:MAG: DUF2062 domain-containing protein [Roseovarius sp.]
MVFKRRDKRIWYQAVADFVWPKGGWARAFHYVKHRVRRLPDPPHRIARGIFAGIFVTFSPLFGLHFFLAAFVAWVMRGNIVASLLATFFGNPVTFVPIGAMSLNTGYYLLGLNQLSDEEVRRSLGGKFVDAGQDLWHNIKAPFTKEQTDWSHLSVFYDEVFLPYLVGGIIPGIIFGLIGYYMSLPLIIAYKNRRKGTLKAKLAAIKEKAAEKAVPKVKKKGEAE